MLRSVCMHRYNIISEASIDGRAVLRVVGRVLEQRHPQSHHHRALYLVAACQWIDDLTRIDDRDHTAHAQAGDLRLPGDFDEVSSERMRRKLRLRVSKGRWRL